MKERISDLIAAIGQFFGKLAEMFMSRSLRDRIIILSVIGCVLAGTGIALAVGISGNDAAQSGIVDSHIKDINEKSAKSTKTPKGTASPSVAPTVSPAGSMAPSPAASALPASTPANKAVKSNAGTSNKAASGGESASAVITGESSIAANAASDGGTDVVEYQERNEYHLQEYENEIVHEDERRIIATSAAACDIMDRLGIDLIGVPETTVSAIASRYSGAVRVGSPMEPDMEIIKQLNPTDVIGPDTLQADLQMKYDNMGVQSTFINLRSVEGLYESVRILGHKYEKQAEADAIIAEYNEFMASYSSGHEGEAQPRVLVLMGLPGSYLVATQNSYAGSLVELAGGVNVFHDDSKDFITVNTEAMLAADPDVIIRTAHGLPEEAIQMFNREFSQNDIWKHFRAVKEGRVYDVDYMLFGMSATFDYPQALADLEPMLYGN